jgi:hypothetical protein
MDERSIDIVDQVLRVRPQHFQDSQLHQLRAYAWKWLTLQRGMQDASPPDLFTLAQIAAAAGGINAAIGFITENLQDRQAKNCQYLVTMLLQRLHGVQPSAFKARRQQFHHAGAAVPAAPSDPEQPDPSFYEETLNKLGGAFQLPGKRKP